MTNLIDKEGFRSIFLHIDRKFWRGERLSTWGAFVVIRSHHIFYWFEHSHVGNFRSTSTTYNIYGHYKSCCL